MAEHNFKNIIAWQKARKIIPSIYTMVNKFPSDEKYALMSQIKRAAVSISSNIAEGSGRNTDKDFAYFLDVALGSANELESELIIATDINFITQKEFNDIIVKIDEIQKLIVGLQKMLRK